MINAITRQDRKKFLFMTEINIEHNVSIAKLDAMGVDAWPVWEKEAI